MERGLWWVLDPRQGEEGIRTGWPGVASQSPNGHESTHTGEEPRKGAGASVGKGGEPRGTRMGVRARGEQSGIPEWQGTVAVMGDRLHPGGLIKSVYILRIMSAWFLTVGEG